MKAPFLHSLRRKWDNASQKAFPRLVRLFVGRVFYGSDGSAAGELDLSMGLVLSLLALPGGFYSILLLDKYSSLLQWMRYQHSFDPFVAALPDEYLFIVLSMTVTGTVAVWRWDSIFPDRRDYANLVPLPISMRQIFLANLAAIVFLSAVLSLDVNAASAFLFPLVVSASENAFTFFVQFVWVHAFVVILASVFSFFAVFATVGVLMALLPQGVFRRVSLYLRGTIIACLVATLATSFVVPPMLEQLPQTLVRFLPPVWFVALCQLIRGRANVSLAALGREAMIGTAIIVVAAIVIYALSYRRAFMRIPETTTTTAARGRGRANCAWIFRTLDRLMLKSPFQRAGYRFVMKTLLRSEHHSLVLGAFVGFGIVTASQFLFASFNDTQIKGGHSPSSEVLAIPLILSYCVILGVRFVLDIPTEIRANWVFQVHLEKTKHECIPLARKVILTFVFPWVFALVFPLYGYLWGWWVGILETVVVALWSLVLGEVLLHRFRKIPFTCSYPPFRDSAVVLALSYVLGFFVFVMLTSHLEFWGLSNPVLMPVVIAIVLLSWYGFSHNRPGIEEADQKLIFEENATASFELLDLGGGSS